MKSFNTPNKVGMDMTRLFMIWSVWFLAIVFIVYLVLKTIGTNMNLNPQSFLSFAYGPSKTYMLIIGIISIYGFLTFYVKQGVTRKMYFIGAAISSVIISIILMIVAGIITIIEQMFDHSIDFTSFLGSDASWLLTVIVFSLNILVYYAVGWMIGAGFYRFGVLGGILYIVLGVLLVSISDILWEFELKNPLTFLIGLVDMWEIPLYVSFIGTFFLIIIALSIVRTTTKRVRIMMK